MATTKSASFRSEREFGLLIGMILLLVGGWWIYRGKFEVLGPSFAALGAIFIVLGILAPRALYYPNQAWFFLARVLSMIMTPVILGVIFFGLITPIGIFRRLIGADPLGRRGGIRESYWKAYHPHQQDPRHYEKMF